MSADMLEEFRINTSLSLEGIGAVLRSEDGFTTIQSLVPGGAAAKTGRVKNGDKIIAVAQGSEEAVDVIDMDLRDVVKLIRGKRGTEVRLTLVREDGGSTTQLVIPVIREQVQLTDRAAKSKAFDVLVGKGAEAKTLKVGVVYLPSFYMDFEGRQGHHENYRSSSSDMKKEIASLKKKGIDALIVDLRSNGGGSLDESITVAGLFINKGPVVQSKAADRVKVYDDEESGVAWDGPLLVMINRHSASASEIFAGAIQDYGRGLIVGDTHTFGKGTVQNVTDITDKLGALKITISKFYRPSGASTQLRGVESDVVLPDLLDEFEVGEKHLDYALPWEKIKRAPFRPVDQVTRNLTALKAASKKRVAADPEFKETLEEIKKYKDGEKERNRISLKEGKDTSKSKKPGEEDEEDLMAEAQEIKLDNDPMLQETLRIAGDYVTARDGKALAAVSLPELAKIQAAKKDGEEKLAKKPSRLEMAPGENPMEKKKPRDGEYTKPVERKSDGK
jgi:carboxyl-terminal processing protease